MGVSRTGLHTGTRFSVRSGRNGTEYTTLVLTGCQTTLLMLGALGVIGFQLIPKPMMLPVFFFQENEERLIDKVYKSIHTSLLKIFAKWVLKNPLFF